MSSTKLCTNPNKTEVCNSNEVRQSKIRERIGKRLAYILRYGALTEGLQVHEGGFVKFQDLIDLPILKRETNSSYLLDELESSLSHRNFKRFELKTWHGETFVRATYGRKFERSKFHTGCKVVRLLELTLDFVVESIEYYDFDDFPDPYLISELMNRLKRKKKLNVKICESLISANIEFIAFDGILVNEKIIRIMQKKCTNLKMLSFKDCGYFLNDHFLELVLRSCKLIEILNLSNCKDLTDRSLYNISKHLAKLRQLDISGNKRYTETAIVHLVESCPNLNSLDMYNNNNNPSFDNFIRKNIVINPSYHLNTII